MTKIKTKEAAEERVEEIKTKIKKLWEEASKLADEFRFTFWYSDPSTNYGGCYYPPKPDDWVDDVDWNVRGTDKDPNRKHPEYEDYHPWDEGYDGWVSSSMRC